MAGPRYKVTDGTTVCEDCGVVVAITEAHTRFHSILSGHAWALAVLKTAHISANVHANYDVVERIDSKQFDSWSGDALAEVIAAHEAQDSQQGERLGMGRSGPARGGSSWPVPDTVTGPCLPRHTEKR